MTSLWIALLITALLFGAKSSLATFRIQMADRRNRLLFAACVVVIAYGVLHAG
jgi:hypothetical protein